VLSRGIFITAQNFYGSLYLDKGFIFEAGLQGDICLLLAQDADTSSSSSLPKEKQTASPKSDYRYRKVIYCAFPAFFVLIGIELKRKKHPESRMLIRTQ